jgi:hypothetical protein
MYLFLVSIAGLVQLNAGQYEKPCVDDLIEKYEWILDGVCKVQGMRKDSILLNTLHLITVNTCQWTIKERYNGPGLDS